jgi:hypothetical protein
MQLESYIAGRWQAGQGAAVALRDATTGEVVASANADGLDTCALMSMPARWAAQICGS